MLLFPRRLLDAIRGSLKNLQSAIKGLIVMNAALESVAQSLLIGKVIQIQRSTN